MRYRDRRRAADCRRRGGIYQLPGGRAVARIAHRLDPDTYPFQVRIPAAPQFRSAAQRIVHGCFLGDYRGGAADHADRRRVWDRARSAWHHLFVEPRAGIPDAAGGDESLSVRLSFPAPHGQRLPGHAAVLPDPAGGRFVDHIRAVDYHGAGAVSYTHLRAHETDSYLVCRLLLEKKKK